MTDLITRVHTALGTDWDATNSPWAGLIRLYEKDPEAFYLLACDGAGLPTDPMPALAGLREDIVLPLATLAQRIRRAVRASYRLTPPAEAEAQVVTENDELTLPADLFPQVRQFLLEIDGKGVSTKTNKDYEGRSVTEAEVRFKLGEPGDVALVQQKVAVKIVGARLSERAISE